MRRASRRVPATISEAAIVRNGFTLIELMVTVSIAAILLTAAVPSYTTMIARNRLASETNEFIGMMALARSEAAKRGTRVTVCASSDQSTCGSDWAAGAIAFADQNGDCAITSGVDEKLRVMEGLRGNATLSGVADDGSAVTCLGYLGVGTTTIGKDADFTMCSPLIHEARVMELKITGRLSKTNATCGE
ncbi:GspH/FimT family pseudopilin [Methylolobus aquaticus]